MPFFVACHSRKPLDSYVEVWCSGFAAHADADAAVQRGLPDEAYYILEAPSAQAAIRQVRGDPSPCGVASPLTIATRGLPPSPPP